MQSWGVAFLGVIALTSVVQVAGLVTLVVLGQRLSRRLGEVQARLDRELTPALADLARASRSVAEVAELAHSRGRHLDRLFRRHARPRLGRGLPRGPSRRPAPRGGLRGGPRPRAPARAEALPPIG